MRAFVTCAHCLYHKGDNGSLISRQWAIVGRASFVTLGVFAYIDWANDLALVFLNVSDVNQFYSNDGLEISKETLTMNTDVEIFGYPGNTFEGLYPDRISATVANLAGNMSFLNCTFLNRNHEIDANVHHGNSGGPLIEKENEQIAGIIVTKSKIISNETRAIAEVANRFAGFSMSTVPLGSILVRTVLEAQNNTHIGRGQAIPSLMLQEFINNPGILYEGHNSYPQAPQVLAEPVVSLVIR